MTTCRHKGYEDHQYPCAAYCQVLDRAEKAEDGRDEALDMAGIAQTECFASEEVAVKRYRIDIGGPHEPDTWWSDGFPVAGDERNMLDGEEFVLASDYDKALGILSGIAGEAKQDGRWCQHDYDGWCCVFCGANYTEGHDHRSGCMRTEAAKLISGVSNE